MGVTLLSLWNHWVFPWTPRDISSMDADHQPRVSELHLHRKPPQGCLSPEFERQCAQPASMKCRTYTEKQSLDVVKLQGQEELSQMILRPLSRNISRRPNRPPYIDRKDEKENGI